MDSIERTLNLAKHGSLSRAELYARICTLAQSHRGPGTSQSQAFSRFITTPDGQELFKILQSLPGKDIEPTWQSPIAKRDTSTWDRLVRAVAKSQGLSYSKAVDACLTTEEGRAAFSEQRRVEKINSGFMDLDMRREALIEKAQNDNRGVKSPYPHAFEVAVNDVLRAHPNFSRSEALDEARRTNPDAWADYKKLGGTGKPLPRSHVPQPGNEDYPEEPTSQRTPTPRPPMWQLDHSGSYSGNTPARTPYRPDVEPKIKGWFERNTPNAQAWYINDMMKTSRLPRESVVVRILKGL
jgi:hypothetical protein